MDEIWKSIKGYSGLYKISNYGSVYSFGRIVNTKIKYVAKRRVLPRILKPTLNKSGSGYYYVELVDKNGRVKNIPIHRLVASAFIPNPNKLKEVNHINCNSLDNRSSNLEWCTHKQNMQHAYKNKRMILNNQKGDKCPASKLSEKQVIEIKKRIARRESIKSISEDYSVGESAISEIKAGRSWRHVIV